MATKTALQARPTMYRGVQMRSRMEAEHAAWLDAKGGGTMPSLIDWRYEPMCFASGAGQYLPDFMLIFDYGHIYEEVKPVVEDFDAIAGRMEIVWESEPSAILKLSELRGDRRTWYGVNGNWGLLGGDVVRVRQ